MDPGGTVVDLLRSCYSTDARLHRGSAEVTRITWYFCDQGAAFLPFPTFASSRNWDTPDTDFPLGKDHPPAGDGTELGEILGAVRPWRNGSNPTGLAGQGWVGDPAWFLSGMPADVENETIDVCFDVEVVLSCAAIAGAVERFCCTVDIPNVCAKAPCCFFGNVTFQTPSASGANLMFGPTLELDWLWESPLRPGSVDVRLAFFWDSNPASPTYGAYLAQYKEGVNPFDPIFQSAPVLIPCNYPTSAFTIEIEPVTGWHYSGTLTLTVRPAWCCSEVIAGTCELSCAAEVGS